jgi:hypothetical protein
MSFDPLHLFTSVGMLASVWLLGAVATLSLIGARKAFRSDGRWVVIRVTLGVFLTLLTIVSCLILFAWVRSPHV